MKILKISDKNIIQKAVKTLKNGGLVIYPTDTIYGVAVDATNQDAVDKLIAYKGHRNNKPISIAVSTVDMAKKYANINQVVKNLYKSLLPGPFTIISKTQDQNLLAKGVPSNENTIGIRIIPLPIINQVIDQLGSPITATSANISGGKNPRSLKDLQKQLSEAKLNKVDLFIDAGQLPYKKPSTIIDASHEDTKILRQGDIIIKSDNNSQQISNSDAETMELASKFIKKILSTKYSVPKPLVILLQGQLGAGKTVFTKGIARDLGIKGIIKSPTYTLVKEYKIPQPKPYPLNSKPYFYHIDAWRISELEELQDLGLDSMINPANIIVIEWPQRVGQIVNDLQNKADLRLVDIKVLSENKRQITITQL